MICRQKVGSFRTGEFLDFQFLVLEICWAPRTSLDVGPSSIYCCNTEPAPPIKLSAPKKIGVTTKMVEKFLNTLV